MTNEEKQLLIKDLSARLPYGLIAQYHGTGGFIKGYEEAIFDIIVDAVDISKHTINYHPYEKGYTSCSSVSGARMFYDRKQMVFIKPYLRPMSIMTEEEVNELVMICDDECLCNECGDVVGTIYGMTLLYGEVEDVYPYNSKIKISPNINYAVLDYLNSHHFDFRGLIEKGLAIEAPEGMYNYGTSNEYEK